MNLNLLFSYKDLLVYIPTILFCLIVLWGFLSGFRRGFRKSIILFINMILALVASGVIFYLLFGNNFDTQIVKYTELILGIFNMNLKDLLQTSQSYTNLSGYLNELFIEYMPEEYFATTSIVTIVSTLMAVVESVVKLAMVIVLLVFYHIVKFLLYIIYLIFFKEGRKKKRIIRRFEEGTSQKEYKRHRLLGSLVGFIRGTAVAVLLFSFIGSFCYILSGGYYSKTKEEVVIEFNDNRYDITEYYDIVNRYGTVGIGKLLESIENSKDVPLYLLVADYITKGNYTVTDLDGNVISGSLYGREELAPIVGLVKEIALTALDYNFDVNKASDTDYLIDFLSKNNTLDGIAFCDRLDIIIDKYNFGDYTIFLGQCLVKAVADNVVTTTSENSENQFVTELLHLLFNGDNKINASDVITNNNINLLLHYVINVSSNYESINRVMESFTASANEEQLVYGIKKNAQIDDRDAEVVEEVLVKTQELITNLDFLNTDKTDALLSDIIVLCFENVLSTYSLEGVKETDSPYSLYNIKWKERLDNVFGYLIDFVKYANVNNIDSTDTLIDVMLSDLENVTSTGYTLLFNILESDVLGVFLNAKGFKDLVNDSLASMNITLPDTLILGNYYNADGELVHGEVYTLVKNVSTKVKAIYTIFSDELLNEKQKLEELFSEKYSLTDLLKNTFDDTNASYSKLLHYMASDLILNIDQFGLEFDIYVPTTCQVIIDENTTIVSSKELVNICGLISTIAPNIFGEEIDYQTLLTSENIDKLMSSEILKSSIAITAYDQISGMDGIGEYIPSSLALDTKDNIEANIEKWVGDTGELHYIVEALSKGDLLNSFFKDEEEIDMVSIVLEMDSSSMEMAMTSNVLNTIVTAKIQEVDLGEVKIIIPSEAKLTQLDGLDRIKPQEMVLVLEIIQDSGFDEIINASDDADKSSLMIEKVLNLSTSTKTNIINSNILNASITSYLETIAITNSNETYSILIPNDCFMDKSVHMITNSDFTACLDAINALLNGEYDFANINFNRILDKEVIDSIDNSKIISATMINLLIGVIDNLDTSNAASKYIEIPQLYKENDLVNHYEENRWVKKKELSNILNSLSLLGITFGDGNAIVMNEEDILKLSINCKDNDSSLQKILQSEILYASVSKVILELDALTIVDALKEDLFTSTELSNTMSNSTVIKKTEILELFSSIEKIIGAEAINSGIAFDELTDYVTVDSLEQRKKLNAESINELLNSVIIETKIASLITESAGDKVLVTNNLSYDTDLTYSNIYKWISITEDGNSKEEISETRKLVNALDSLKLFNLLTSDSQSFDLNSFTKLTDEQLTSVLSSELIHATFVYQFYDKALSNDAIKLPVSYQDAMPSSTSNTDKTISDIIKSDFDNLKMVKDEEIKSIIKAISTLALDLDNISLNANIILDLNDPISEESSETKLSQVKDSDIIWFTLSDFLFNTGKLEIPDTEVFYMDGVDKYATQKEVASVINAMKELNIGNFDSDISVDTILSTEVDIKVVCESKILWLTMSKKITETEQLEKDPSVYVDINDSATSTLSKDYISTDELSYLIAGINELNINFSSSVDINEVMEKDMLVICKSVILWKNISSKILDITTFTIDTNVRVDVKGDKNVSGDFVDKTEIQNLMNGIGSLTKGNFNSTISADNILNADIDLVCKSIILWRNISDKMNEIDDLSMHSSIYVDLENNSTTNTTYISVSEIKNFKNGIQELVPTGSSISSGFNLDKVFDADMGIVCKSTILWLTVSSKIKGVDGLIQEEAINSDVDNNKTINGEFIVQEEISNLITGLGALGLNSISGSFSVDTILGNELNITTICASIILWKNISYKLKDVSTLTIPYSVLRNVENKYTANGNYIDIDEISNCINGIKSLSFTNFTSFAVNDILSKDLDKSIWNSLIISATTTNTLLKVNSLMVTTSIFRTSLDNQNDKIITSDELVNFINALKSIGANDVGNVDVSLTTVTNNVTTLLNSYIIRSTISYEMFMGGQLASVAICSEDQAYKVSDSGSSSTNTIYVINSLDIKAFITAAESIGLSSYEATQLTPSDTTIEAISNSEILKLTYNDMIETSINTYNLIPFYTSIEITYKDSMQVISLVEEVFEIKAMTNILSDKTISDYTNALGAL